VSVARGAATSNPLVFVERIAALRSSGAAIVAASALVAAAVDVALLLAARCSNLSSSLVHCNVWNLVLPPGFLQ